VLQGDFGEGDHIVVDVGDNGVKFEKRFEKRNATAGAPIG
jgi:hypothetical protein